MAKLYDVMGDEKIQEELDGPNIILIVPEHYLLASSTKQKFTFKESANEVTGPGLYYFRATNDLNRGIILGQLLSSVHIEEVITNRPEQIKSYELQIPTRPISSYKPGADQVVPDYPKSQSNPIPAKKPLSEPPPVPRNVPRGKKKTPIEIVYWDTLLKYVNNSLLNATSNKIKGKSITNQIKNFCTGSIRSVRDVAGQIPNEEEMTQYIINDLIANELIEETGVDYEINQDIVEACFKYRNRTFISIFDKQEPGAQNTDIIGMCSQYVQTYPEISVKDLYSAIYDLINRMHPNASQDDKYNYVLTLMKETIQRNRLIILGASLEQILQDVSNYQNIILKKP